MTAPFYRFGKQGFVAKFARFYWYAACRVRRPDVPMPRKRHEIFAKVYPTDHRGELRVKSNIVYSLCKNIVYTFCKRNSLGSSLIR